MSNVTSTLQVTSYNVRKLLVNERGLGLKCDFPIEIVIEFLTIAFKKSRKYIGRVQIYTGDFHVGNNWNFDMVAY